MESTKNLKANEGVEKLKELVTAINICLFSTNLKRNDGATCRPMSAQEVDAEGNIWFFSGMDSDKNREIQEDKLVQLVFSHPGKSSYMIVNGEAEVSTDRKRIEELWSPVVKIWFKEGKTDPNISLIKVNTRSAYYWDADGNKMINFFKFLASIATGSNLVTGVQGSIKA
ncbi:MAG: pyridoxamine 5'-phosphate oxidase family protein [Saprospiraceae bacterium]|nr:pyridoxamine 5'-phosphate oxidase family protein [Saprospiraceae bacterium]